jgi:hypothetical protein
MWISGLPGAVPVVYRFPNCPVSYPVVRDATGATPSDWGILGMPTGYLLDRQGVVRLVHQGYRRSDGEALRIEIMQLLKE